MKSSSEKWNSLRVGLYVLLSFTCVAALGLLWLGNIASDGRPGYCRSINEAIDRGVFVDTLHAKIDLENTGQSSLVSVSEAWIEYGWSHAGLFRIEKTEKKRIVFTVASDGLQNKYRSWTVVDFRNDTSLHSFQYFFQDEGRVRDSFHFYYSDRLSFPDTFTIVSQSYVRKREDAHVLGSIVFTKRNE